MHLKQEWNEILLEHKITCSWWRRDSPRLKNRSHTNPAAEGPGICSSVFTCCDGGAGMTSAHRSAHLSSGSALLPDNLRAWGSILLKKFMHWARKDAAAHVSCVHRYSLYNRTSALLPHTPFCSPANGQRRERESPAHWSGKWTWSDWSFIMGYTEISLTALQTSAPEWLTLLKAIDTLTRRDVTAGRVITKPAQIWLCLSRLIYSWIIYPTGAPDPWVNSVQNQMR